MKKMKKALSVVLAGALALGLMACSGNSGSATPAPSEEKTSAQQNDVQTESQKESSVADKKSEEGPIIVGFLGWSSGADAMYGLVPQHLLETYFKKVNAEGGWLGREIDFRTYDISGLDGDFSEAVNAANKLIQSGAVAILGPSNSTQGSRSCWNCATGREFSISHPVHPSL